MSNEVISIGNELKTFEIEKQNLLEKYNRQINNQINSEERISCYMAAIYYEYERLNTMGKRRAMQPDPMCQSKEGRAKLLKSFIGKAPQSMIQEIVSALQQSGITDFSVNPQSIENIIPVVKKLATPTLNRIDSLKKELQEVYLKHNIPFMHISPVNIEDRHINPSVNLENQPQNQIMTGVFATSSYEGINEYIARAIAGGMIRNREKVQYPKNPFLSVNEQTNPNRIKLSRPVFAYELDANGFEPQIHFAPSRDGFEITFGDEWVKSTDKPLEIQGKEVITEVDSAPFLKIDTRYVDNENRRILSYREMFAKKFGIQITQDVSHHNNTQEH